MKILGYEFRKLPNKEERQVKIAPTTSIGLPYAGLNASLSAEQAMRLSAVYRCVDVRSDSIATMPWDVMVFNKQKEWVKDTFHFSWNMLNTEPNPSMSKFDFMKTLTAQVDLNGNAYVQVIRDSMGNPASLILQSGIVTMYVRDDYSIYYEVLESYSNRGLYVAGEDMIHVKNFSYDGYLGVSTITHATNITGLAEAADGQAAGYYKNGANMNGVLAVPGKVGADKAEQLKKSWMDSVGYNSATGVGGGVVVVEGGVVYTPIQINPKDAQMIETREFNVVDICRFFGVSPIKAFDMSSSTYASVESYQLGYITDTVTPLARKIENEFNRKLYRPSQRNKVKVALDIEELMSADLDTLGNYYTKMIQCGAYSPNEIRRKRKMPLIPDGDKSYVQVNLAPVGQKPEPIQNKNTGVKDENNGI
jgi:HK97 family phage portal protein